LPPLLYAAAVLVSAWVLADARRRRLPFYAVATWTLAALIFPHIVLPLYLVARIFTPKPAANETPEATTPPANTETTDTQADNSPLPALLSDDAGEQATGQTEKESRVPPRRWRRWPQRRLALPALYALALLSAGAIYFYRDYHSFDAHLARAANARLREHRAATIREYRAALRLHDDAHTHKLLAVQLAEDGQPAAALEELRAAERGGEPDELLSYGIARALDALGRTAEAHREYQKFLRVNMCTRPAPDARCAEASARAEQIQGNNTAN
jgi:tetratricopeptide (TPR) repeat protein